MGYWCLYFWMAGFPLNSLKLRSRDLKSNLLLNKMWLVCLIHTCWKKQILVESSVPGFFLLPAWCAAPHAVLGIPGSRQSAAAWNVVKCVSFHLDSERIMGSPSLQPDMEDESSELLLEEGFLNRLKDKYCCRLKVRLVMTERYQWRVRQSNEKTCPFLHWLNCKVEPLISEQKYGTSKTNHDIFNQRNAMK